MGSVVNGSKKEKVRANADVVTDAKLHKKQLRREEKVAKKARKAEKKLKKQHLDDIKDCGKPKRKVSNLETGELASAFPKEGESLPNGSNGSNGSNGLKKSKVDKCSQNSIKVASESQESVWAYTPAKELKKIDKAVISAYYETNQIGLNGIGLDDKDFRPILEFRYANFPSALSEAFASFKQPTPIQASTWPVLLKGRDVVGIAKTGSGKTMGFAVPAVMKLNRMGVRRSPEVNHVKFAKPKVLMLSPTRELAVQIQEQCEKVSALFQQRSVVVYGGVNKQAQVKLLCKNGGADIVVATPGRLVDLLDDGCIDITQVCYFVLDEADRMLDLGFEDAIKRVMQDLPTKDSGKRQTVMFSATWPPSVRDLAAKYLQNPVTITVGSIDLRANDAIKQTVEVVEPYEKDTKLVSLLQTYHKNRKNRVLVFALYKKEADRVEQMLQRKGWNCCSIHGDKTQRDRSDALQGFKSGKVPLLIATDVAARGLDIPDVEFVINYTFPLTVEEYCHRIGRTGRAGKSGVAHTLFTHHDKHHSGALINVLNEAKQDVPESLLKFGTTVKRKEHKEYGAFFKEIDPSLKATKIKFDSDSDE